MLSLKSPDTLAIANEHFLLTFRSKIYIVQALNVRKALGYLADENLAWDFVTDEGINEDKNSEDLSSLIRWVNAGGIAVIGCLFPHITSRREFD